MDKTLIEHRCFDYNCNAFLFQATKGTSTIKIKCRKCGKMNNVQGIDEESKKIPVRISLRKI